MSPGIVTTPVDPEFAIAARMVVDNMIGSKVAQLVANPSLAQMVLAKNGLDMLDFPAVAARAGAMIEQEMNRPHRGAFEFGRMRDLRAVAEYARHMIKKEFA